MDSEVEKKGKQENPILSLPKGVTKIWAIFPSLQFEDFRISLRYDHVIILTGRDT